MRENDKATLQYAKTSVIEACEQNLFLVYSHFLPCQVIEIKHRETAEIKHRETANCG